MDQFDPLQVFLRQVFTPYSRLLTPTAFVVVSRVGCPGVYGVLKGIVILCKNVSSHILNFMDTNRSY